MTIFRSQETIKDFQYKLVKIEGSFNSDKYALVSRMTDARMGFYVVRPFTEKTNNWNILVNCGWIPEDMKHEKIEIGKSLKKGELIGIVKRDENLEIKRTDRLYPKTDELFNLIDLCQLSEHFGENLSQEKGGFIDLIKKDGDLNDEDELYPVAPTNKNFQKPYLTPRKHMEYATFWGGTATIGLLSIIRVLML
jgi:cytochrome oxidase assembly protein ShyY1